ncbi:unnamed protein product [Musa acuminata subsp. burmannicoides]
MRDLVGCFANQAVRVAEATCASRDASSAVTELPIQNAITGFYRSLLSSRKELLTAVTWSRNQAGASLSVTVEDGSSASSKLLRKKKGSLSFASGGGSAIALHWDVSAATYASGPEPTKDFYVVVVADAELVLLLGDRWGEFVKKLDGGLPVAEFRMVGRTEQVRGPGAYSTRAQLGDGGEEHEIEIVCRGDERDAEGSELHVAIDKERLVSVERLQWNFRGSKTILVDGSTVDVMWDMHDWWFSGASPCALFVFRRRNSMGDRRVWPDEESALGISGFSLLIQAFKSL